MSQAYDTVVIGAGPVGSVAAHAFGERGDDVLLIEANPAAAARFAGEWLHPPGVEMLDDFGLTPIEAADGCGPGLGFTVFPDDGGEPIKLPYVEGREGRSCHHRTLVEELREHASNHPNVEYRPFVRATEVEPGRVRLDEERGSVSKTVYGDLIVGADGKSSVAREPLGDAVEPEVVSYMGALTLEGFEMPFEGYGHVILGGPGPALLYRIGEDRVRMSLDVPIDVGELRRDPEALYDAFEPVLPPRIAAAMRDALDTQPLQWAAAHFQPHVRYGGNGIALVGDAVGAYHPMTAVGMTSGFQDVACLVESPDLETYRERRARGSYVPELLSSALYKVFEGREQGAQTIRRAVYETWRTDEKLCEQTMRLLSGAETRPTAFAGAFLKIALRGVVQTSAETARQHGLLALTRVLANYVPWARWPIAPLLPESVKQRMRRTATIDTPFALSN